jgi:hypothetical protein
MMKSKIAFGIVSLLVIAGSIIVCRTLFFKSKLNPSTSGVEVIKPVKALGTTKKSHQQEMIDGLPVVRTLGDFMTIENIDELTAESELIVIGKTAKSIREVAPVLPKLPDGTIVAPFSVVPFKVNKVFKGDKSLKEIPVGQTAAVIQENGKSYIRTFDQYMPIEPNQKYILFLQKGLPGSEGEDVYFSTGVIFGQHNTSNDKEVEAYPDNRFKEIRKIVKERFKGDIQAP